MTIHSDWSRILHDECKEAFGAKPPAQCPLDVGIIDGHLQLMRLDVRMGTWECFVRNQFLKPIQALFGMGCPRVALCFDNYGAVPTYKSMTQTSRSSRHDIRNFGPQDSLPPHIPEDPVTYLMNRNFKLRLIEMLCERVPPAIKLEEGQEFILDYKRVVSYAPGERAPMVMKDMACMGESDVKFCRYVSKYGNALVHAIDGDYMAIALLYYTQHGLQPRNRIFIYRQLSMLHSGTVGRKRKQADQPTLCFFKPMEPPPSAKPKMCWVNMQQIYKVLARAMLLAKSQQQCINPLTSAPFTDQDAVFSMVFLMLCAGTDFSRNTPLLGPKRMWEALPLICAPLLQAVRGAPEVNQSQFLNLVIARLYAQSFTKHVMCSAFFPPNLELVLQSLQKSRLSEGTKQKLPSAERMRTTLQNIGWVIKYWTMENGDVETPEDGAYGYVRNREGELTFADLCP
jgi:hypothetical protein